MLLKFGGAILDPGGARCRTAPAGRPVRCAISGHKRKPRRRPAATGPRIEVSHSAANARAANPDSHTRATTVGPPPHQPWPTPNFARVDRPHHEVTCDRVTRYPCRPPHARRPTTP
ncbi:hypothetical protein ACU686_42375 [Yinghuangia aomiensis]